MYIHPLVEVEFHFLLFASGHFQGGYVLQFVILLQWTFSKPTQGSLFDDETEFLSINICLDRLHQLFKMGFHIPPVDRRPVVVDSHLLHLIQIIKW